LLHAFLTSALDVGECDIKLLKYKPTGERNVGRTKKRWKDRSLTRKQNRLNGLSRVVSGDDVKTADCGWRRLPSE